jgi:aryl-alcohol dehydrogenase-like predicted oxidoreductase
MERRDFLRGLAGALAAGYAGHALADETSVCKQASDRVKLGGRNLNVSRLGIGTGTVGWDHSSNQTRKLGLKGLADLLRAAYDHGVTLWDSADQYGSHPHIAEALKSVPREKVTIMTKTQAKTEQEMRVALDRYRRELATDYIDVVLLHCMTGGEWNKRRRGAMDALSEAREKGIVRAHGVSCHSLAALRTAAAEPWVDVDFARINPANVKMDAKKETVTPILEGMKKSGKGIIGMKIFGEGKLRDRADEMLSYVLKLACVDSFVIGVESREELDDLIKRIRKANVRVS